jgi:hypothetical protein
MLVGALFFVDWCVLFGSRGSPRIWCEFFALVAWLTEIRFAERGVGRKLFAWMDDTYGVTLKRLERHYAPYNTVMPAAQVAMLELWDEIGLPHEASKQLNGQRLVIIGFEVDVVLFSFRHPLRQRFSSSSQPIDSSTHSVLNYLAGSKR